MDSFCWGLIAFAGVIGMWVGQRTQDQKWREKGDHEYMNRMTSGGALYQVKREKSDG